MIPARSRLVVALTALFLVAICHARPLTERAVENLVTLTKLLGYVRFFHPSDEAAATNWDQFAVQGVKAVEPVHNPAELAAVLNELFQPIAPTVRVFPTGQKIPDPPDLEPPKDAPDAKVTAWRHYGVGLSKNSFYRSRRLNIDSEPSDKAPASALPDPTKPYIVELGGGVSCLVPLALYVADGRTLPHGSPQPLPEVALSGNDRSTRLAAVVLAWNVFQHFYPYFDVVRTDWPGALSRALRGAATDSGEETFLWTLRRMVAELHDGHGSVSLPNERIFLPPFSWRWVEGRLVITYVMKAGASSLERGEVVLRIGGKPAAEAVSEAEEYVSAATPQHRRIRALWELLSGDEGSVLRLDLQRSSGQEHHAEIARTVSMDDHVPEPIKPRVYELRPGILYVNLRSISNAAFEEAAPKLAEAKGIVFDVRGYPRIRPQTIGHLIGSPVTCARWLVPVVFYPDRQKVAFDLSQWTVHRRRRDSTPGSPFSPMGGPSAMRRRTWELWRITSLAILSGNLPPEPTATSIRLRFRVATR